jgi:molecular chaperone DnaJ
MDFYILLGVQREATPADIKRAYRRLARRYHPDINPGDGDAATRFRLILDAYETLIDPESRRRYDSGTLHGTPDDRASFGFAGFDFSGAVGGHRATTFGDLFEEVFTRRADRERQPEQGRGADLHLRVSLSFEEAWRGAERALTLTRQVPCRSCTGSGQQRTADRRCHVCEGSGVVRSARGHMVFAKNCPNCGGSGQLRQQPCATCHGQGVETRTDGFSINVPAGIADGGQLRMAGKGHAGAKGAPPGDLYVDVEVRPHPRFRREGDTLHYVLPVAIHEAALGAKIEIPTPDGVARLRVPPGTQSGRRFRLSERGMPSPRGGPNGDLVIEVRLMLPELLDERSKELLREFGRINGESVRAERRTKN